MMRVSSWLRRMRRRLTVWWGLLSIDRQAKRAGYRSGRFVACALNGGWDNVPSYTKDMLRRALTRDDY